MIIASQKPVEEIANSLRAYKKVLIATCGTCVAVCLSGGEKEARELASLLSLTDDRGFAVVTPERQCDAEFLAAFDEDVERADAVLSMACGVGVQYMAERYAGKPVIPALNTCFLGANRDAGYWTEMCQGCGDCILERTGGVCPVARCSKSHFNGPCGGSANGKCEVDDAVDCGWQLIYDRLKSLNQIERLYEIIPPRDWSTGRDGGPRRLRRPDVAIEEV
jgi:ferredoxin